MAGVGKSWVGAELSKQLGVTWFDLDEEIQIQQGKTISELFDEFGESHFRVIETAVLGDLLGRPEKCVISLGGGTVVESLNRMILGNSAYVIFLRAEFQMLYEYLQGDMSRPLLRGDLAERISELLAERDPINTELANFIIDMEGKSSSEASRDIIEGFVNVVCAEEPWTQVGKVATGVGDEG